MYGLDLFSGIGGITKALEGYVRPVAYCDIEPYSRSVLLSRMATGDLPPAPVWDDVTQLRGDMLPHIDIIYGGFPCQDISVAGKQIGLDGKRSGLFSEIVRLAKETKAEWLFLENVPNIRTKGLGRVLKTLADSGYDCRWGALSAADVGANHKRERWFLLAHSTSVERATGAKEPRELQAVYGDGSVCDNSSRPGEDVAHSTGKQNGRIRESGVPSDTRAGGSVADSHSQSESRLCGRTEEKLTSTGTFSEPSPRNSWWDVEPDVGRVANGVPKRVDRLRALGNAVVPAQAREAFERLMGLK